MPAWPGFVGGSYPTSSLVADAERTVNLYVEKMQSEGAKAPSALYPTPGFRMWDTVADIGSRAFKAANGRFFGVVGGGVYEWSSTGVSTKHGTVAQDSNPAQIIFNGVVGGQLGIVSGGNVYSFELATNTLSAAILTGGYTHLSYSDGYGLAFNPTTGRTQLSDLNDLSTYGGLTFFTRSKFPDPAVAVFVDQNALVWVLGSETFEVRYNTGVGTQPFEPLSGLYGRHGIVAPFAYSVTGFGVHWVARSPEGGAGVVATRGSAPQPVSNYGINAAIAAFARTGRISDAEVLPYHDQGHTFINCAFPSGIGSPSDAPTLTYDVEGASWGSRGMWNSATGRYDLWAPRVHVDIFGKHLVGDRTTGTIWEMDTTIHTDVDGSGIRRVRRAPGITNEHKREPIDNLELLMDVGVGTQSGQGQDPQALLRISEDGGNTFGNERRAGLGAVGQYRKRVYWNRLGAPPDAVAEVVWTDPVPTRVVGAWLNNHEKAA